MAGAVTYIDRVMQLCYYGHSLKFRIKLTKTRHFFSLLPHSDPFLPEWEILQFLGAGTFCLKGVTENYGISN
jgi:hypothetical protein